MQAVAVCGGIATAVETKVWEQADYAAFEKGERKGVSLGSDGRLMLAPLFKEVLDSSSAYLWALAEDSKGNLYAGGGGPGGPGARLYIVTPDGKSRVLAELEGLEIHAIAIDRNDRIYAATSPDGKIYRLGPDGKPEVFYDPRVKYIWALAFNGKGDLFVATGDGGAIHKIGPDGKGLVFYRTDETHVRSLAVDARGNLIAGTEPGGLILRITPAGEGFVLYQAPKREVTAVAVGSDGSIWAAGVGSKQPAAPGAPPPPPSPPKPAEPAQTTLNPQAPGAQAGQRPQPPPPSLAPAPAVITGGSEVYRIDAEGFARRIWNHNEDIVYAIGFDAQGRPVIGTGNKGAIYRLDSDLIYTALLSAPPTQVTAFAAGRQGKLYAATGNSGRVYQIGPGLEKQGFLESELFDATLFSRWGRLSWRAKANGGAVRFETRSGNLDRPQRDWSPWAVAPAEGDSGRIQSPAARFLQWKVTITASADGKSPEVESVQAAYLPKNVAPLVEVIEITPPNYRFPQQSLTLTPSQTITLQPLSRGKKAPPPVPVTSGGAVSMQYEKGQIGARWEASDLNGDTLTHKVEIRGVNESVWKLLKDKLKDKQLSWDSTAFPDGLHQLRVTSSDSPDNPPDQALSSSLVSEPFLIDNTAPEILGLAATTASNKLVVMWKSKDGDSVLQKAEYSVNGGEWTLVEPAGALSDSREHEYRLELERPAAGEVTIAVRATDEFDNQSVQKVVVR